MPFFDDDDADLYDLARERSAERRRQAQFRAHPDPRDPEHPDDEEGE